MNEKLYEIEEYCCEYCLLQDAVETLIQQKMVKKLPMSTVAISADSETIKDIMRVVFADDMFDIKFMNFDDDEFEEHTVIMFLDDNFELECCIEPSYLVTSKGNKYLNFGADVHYIHEGCNSKMLIENTKYSNENIVCFSFDE